MEFNFPTETSSQPSGSSNPEYPQFYSPQDPHILNPSSFNFPTDVPSQPMGSASSFSHSSTPEYPQFYSPLDPNLLDPNNFNFNPSTAGTPSGYSSSSASSSSYVATPEDSQFYTPLDPLSAQPDLGQQYWDAWQNQSSNIPAIDDIFNPKPLTLHALLQSQAGYTWDIRHGPHTADPDTVTERLTEAATSPEVQSIILTSPFFPWQLAVVPRRTPYVTVGDVLHTIHEMAVSPLAPADTALISPAEKEESTRQYEARYGYIVDKGERLSAMTKGILKMDLLQGHLRFDGIAMVPIPDGLNGSRPGQVWQLIFKK
ncbi:uncharacterized protein FIBRA_07730 [Fibroporia radiculosa]|uniref:DUF6699 domain-containing protein n=1 Tax=Fibroporia radiculosa TaxID=599839 RepID=J4I187_9APHY|nr:uncharacterized protein FIBRA_07730 [Fibroporia radiculosa]CCM05507.1 predicted protein [Fibroporia radiculosa]